jgi:hypothetical protein
LSINIVFQRKFDLGERLCNSNFRHLLERAVRLPYSSMHLLMNKTIAVTDDIVTCHVNSFCAMINRQSPCISNHPADIKTAPTPSGIVIVRRASKAIFKHLTNPLSAICLNSIGVKPINAVAPTVTAIIRSFIYIGYLLSFWSASHPALSSLVIAIIACETMIFYREVDNFDERRKTCPIHSTRRLSRHS